MKAPPTSPDQRPQQFQQWIRQALAAGKLRHREPLVLEPISGDAGFRSYFRISGTHPALLAVDAPPATEKNHAFCHIARLLRQHGIHAPQVYAVDFERGFLLIEDLGGLLYWPLLQAEKQQQEMLQKKKSPSRQPALYQEATQCLLRMHRMPAADAGLESYDAERLRQEMLLFPEWFIKKLLRVEIPPSVQQQFENIFDLLIASALQQPQVVVHRDFHCRNLLKTESNSPGVIDFQDGVIGAITYDLVSLYRDCYISWPANDVVCWVEIYRQQLLAQHLLADVSEAQFLRWFDWMGLQRHIKVLGIFARLYLRDGKTGYLKDLPLVIHYTLSIAKLYPEFADFVLWFESELLPKAQACDWYRDIET
jgi:aminoglycoside/choline kinase family phosphotransferase